MLRFLLLLLALATPAGAQAPADFGQPAGTPAATVVARPAEIHAVSVGSGWTGRSGSRALVTLDRPQQEVILLLASPIAVRWEVEVTPRTRLASVVIQGPEADRSTLVLNLDAYSDAGRRPVVRRDPAVAAPTDERGPEFRRYLREMARLFGVPRLASIAALPHAPTPQGRVVVSGLDDPAEVDPDPLPEPGGAGAGALAGLPLDPLRLAWVLAGADPPGPVLGPDGVQGPNGRVAFPFPTGLEPFDGAVADLGESLLVVASDTGAVLSIDRASGRWRLSAGLGPLRLGGLLPEPEGRGAILGASREGEGGGAPTLILAELDAGGRLRSSRDLPVDHLPGYLDLADPNFREWPPLVPIAADGLGILVAASDAERHPFPRAATAYRVWLVPRLDGPPLLVDHGGP